MTCIKLRDEMREKSPSKLQQCKKGNISRSQKVNDVITCLFVLDEYYDFLVYV